MTSATKILSTAIAAYNTAEQKLASTTKMVAAATLVAWVRNGGDTKAEKPLRTMLDKVTNESTRKHIAAWVFAHKGKSLTVYQEIAKSHGDDDKANVEAVLDHMTNRTGQPRTWKEIRDEWRVPADTKPITGDATVAQGDGQAPAGQEKTLNKEGKREKAGVDHPTRSEFRKYLQEMSAEDLLALAQMVNKELASRQNELRRAA